MPFGLQEATVFLEDNFLRNVKLFQTKSENYTTDQQHVFQAYLNKVLGKNSYRITNTY